VKILVYDDNPDYGGHQIMAAHGIEALAFDPSVQIECMINPCNRNLAERLNGTGVPVIPVSRTFKKPPPDLVLCIQGDLRQSTHGIAAAKHAGIECVSYLAIPHTLAAMGAKAGALRDKLNRKLLNQPDRYIVISESMRKILLQRGVTKPIDIVPNGVPVPKSTKIKDSDSRFTLGLLGRVEFKQKQQNFMVEAFHSRPDIFGECSLVIAGNGPDRGKLAEQVNRSARKSSITLLPWQKDSEDFYGMIDCLVIPSRFEGVPLVMLEALIRGIPVLGSRTDGMKDLLPVDWTFEPGNAESLVTAFINLRAADSETLTSLQETVRSGLSLEVFKQRFREAVTGPVL
jgi:glycosyltransferase involved in cell wall biosynthesis